VFSHQKEKVLLKLARDPCELFVNNMQLLIRFQLT